MNERQNGGQRMGGTDSLPSNFGSTVDQLLGTASSIAVTVGMLGALKATTRPPHGSTSVAGTNAAWIEPSNSSAPQQPTEVAVQEDHSALLARIRDEYERLPTADWFQEVYEGKSLGESLPVL